MVEASFPRIYLLLGSFDDKTLALLEQVKEEIETAFVSHPEQVSAVLLDRLELYKFNLGGRELMILLEVYDEGLSISVLDGPKVIDAEDFPGANPNETDATILGYLKKTHGVASFKKLSIVDKLGELSSLASLTFVIRDQELTRGGEYIELLSMLQTRLPSARIRFLKREGIVLSEMAWEILDLHGVSSRSYGDNNFLLREVVRIIRNDLK